MSLPLACFDVAAARGDSLRTARLLLRPPEEADIPEIVAIAGDRAVATRVARVPHPYRAADAHFFLDTIVPSSCVWAITPAATGAGTGADTAALIGMIGLHPDPEAGTVELGYYLAPRWWGRGLASEAATAVVAYGIGLLGPRRIIAGHFLDNPASGRVLEKLGFVEDGVEEIDCLATGQPTPSRRMRLP